MYPDIMEANGHSYPINTDYRVALACFKALYDPEISDLERFYAIEGLLLGTNVLEEDEPILREKISKYLSCERENEFENDEVVSYHYIQDEKITRTSIRQCYHLDLNSLPYLHWYEYNELIEGLTDDTLLSKIREIRTINTNKISDTTEKEKIEKLKRVYAIKEVKVKTEREKELDEFWDTITGGD